MDEIAENSELKSDREQFYNLQLVHFMRGVNGEAFATYGNIVRSGPFFGMQIPAFNPFWPDTNSGCKLFGTYEIELHPVLEFAKFRRPKVIVNVGCAEGYYAVGFARYIPEAKVIAFDLDEGSLGLCAEYAKRNDVEVTTRIGGKLPSDILVTEPGHKLYFMDVEGDELELVDRDLFKNCDLIVECHDFLWPEIGSIVADRLWSTHRVEKIKAEIPDLRSLDVVRAYPSFMTILAVLEKRPMPCYWLACWANEKGT